MRRPRRPRQGPAARYQKALQNLQQAQAGGTAAEQFDARDWADQAGKSFAKAQQRQQAAAQPAWMERAGQAFATSRVSFGKGGAQLMPLVGKLAGVFGAVGAAAGPVGAAFTALTSHLAGMSEAVQQVSASLQAFGNQAELAGATAGQTAQFAAIAGGPEGFAARARDLTERLKTDLYAQQATGVAIPRGPFGPANEGALLIRQMENLRALRGDEAAQLRFARATGLEWALSMVNVSDAAWEAQKRLAAETERVYSPENTAAARDFAAWQAIIAGHFQNLVTSTLLPTIKTANQMFSDLEKVLREVGKSAEQAGKDFDKAFDAAFGKGAGAATRRTGQKAGESWFMPPPLQLWFWTREIAEAIARALGMMPKKPGAAGSPGQAQNANTQAIQDLTEMLRQIAGGGVRARAALPPALWSYANRQAAIDASLDLRGFRGF